MKSSLVYRKNLYSLESRQAKIERFDISSRGIMTCLFVFGISILPLWGSMIYGYRCSTALLLSISVFLSLLPMILGYMRQGSMNVFLPVNIFLLFYVLFWIIESAYIAARGYELFYVGSMNSYHINSFDNSLMWSTVGLIAFLSAYYFSKATGFARLMTSLFPKLIDLSCKKNIKIVRKKTYLFFLFIFVLYAMFMNQQGGVVHFINNWKTLRYSAGSGSSVFFIIFYMLQPVIWILFICVLGEAKNNRNFCKRSVLCFLCCLFIGILILFSLGSRGAILILMGGMMLIYHYCQKPITFKQLLFLFIFALIFALSMRGYRYFLARGNWEFRNKLDSSIIDTISRDLWSTDVGYYYMDNVPKQHAFIYGRSLTDIPFFIIPRKIWRSKPIALGPEVLLLHFFPDRGSKSHMGPSLNGELYINFSHMGIILGMTILGFFYQIIEKYLSSKKRKKIERSVVYIIAVAFGFYLLKCGVFDATTRLIVIWLFPVFLLLYLPRIRCFTRIS